MKDSKLYFLRGVLHSDEYDQEGDSPHLLLITNSGHTYRLNCGEVYEQLAKNLYDETTLIVVPISRIDREVLVVAQPKNTSVEMDELSLEEAWGYHNFGSFDDFNSDSSYENFDSFALNSLIHPRSA